MWFSGGVSKALSRAAGGQLERECKRIGEFHPQERQQTMTISSQLRDLNVMPRWTIIKINLLKHLVVNKTTPTLLGNRHADIVRYIYMCMYLFSGTIGSDGFAVTKAGKLSCAYVIHLDAPGADEGRWKTLIVDCLIEAERRRFKSVSFPALGTGRPTSFYNLVTCFPKYMY